MASVMPQQSPGPVGPWGTPQHRQQGPRRTRRMLGLAIIAIIVLGTGVRAYQDLSRPEAWAYWNDLYFSPKLTASLVPGAYTDAHGQTHPVLAVSGEIGAAAAGWFRTRLDAAHLNAGDMVLLSSPGGNLDQGMIMGEVIRARGLVTAVGRAGADGHLRASYCASACVFAFAGGIRRLQWPGSQLGVHRFKAALPQGDPVAAAQAVAGLELGYITRMGISSQLVEAMSATDDIRWVADKDARDMKLVTGSFASR